MRQDPVGHADSQEAALSQTTSSVSEGSENSAHKDVVEKEPADEEDEDEFVKSFLREDSDGPPKSDLFARVSCLTTSDTFLMLLL